MSKKHTKHAKLERREISAHGAVEIAIHGAPCSDIQALANKVIATLGSGYSLSYIDTDHKAFDNDLMPTYLRDGAGEMVSDKINYLQINRKGEINDFDRKQLHANIDLALLNGNHHSGAEQIVILNSSITASLEKRQERLTNILAFVDQDGNKEIPAFIKDRFPDWQSIPVFDYEDTDSIVHLAEGRLQSAKPKVKGLLLAGGKSVRMGHDKGEIEYHGKSQRTYAADLLKAFCEDVYISCRPDQIDELSEKEDHDLLPDTVSGLGPYGAIMSAFREDPNAAWLVVACDLPLVDKASVKYLLENRSSRHIATAFHNETTGFPDPLFTLWEPKAYPRILHFLSLGYSCPRKVLINSDSHILQTPDQDVLSNVNTPEDLENIRKSMGSVPETH